MKKKIEAEKKEYIIVKMNCTYIGKLGDFYKDKIYKLPIELYEMLKMDCEEI